MPCISCLDNLVQPLITSNYLIETIDENGCVAEDRVTVFVNSDGGVYVPNVFSPNGDGSNDLFFPQFTSAVERVNKLSIFSRWGELIFSVQGQNPDSDLLKWDGKYEGKLLNPGVFIYTIDVVKINGERVSTIWRYHFNSLRVLSH